jgi:hypothetical protein
MRLNVKNVNDLIQKKFNDNQTLFAKEINADRTHLNRVLRSNGIGAGAVICGGIIKYCEENNLNYRDYIFLE